MTREELFASIVPKRSGSPQGEAESHRKAAPHGRGPGPMLGGHGPMLGHGRGMGRERKPGDRPPADKNLKNKNKKGTPQTPDAKSPVKPSDTDKPKDSGTEEQPSESETPSDKPADTPKEEPKAESSTDTEIEKAEATDST